MFVPIPRRLFESSQKMFELSVVRLSELMKRREPDEYESGVSVSPRNVCIPWLVRSSQVMPLK